MKTLKHNWTPETPPWKRALLNKSLAWMQDGCDEIEFFRRWRELWGKHCEKRKLVEKARRDSDPERSRAYMKSFYDRDKPHARKLARESRDRRKLDPERLEKYRKYCRENTVARLKSDPAFKLRFRTRTRILESLKRGVSKASGTVDLIGCTIPEYKAHIESLWKPGMNWDNHGRGADKWHIDHIRPCKDFDLSDPAQQRECFNFKNTQPLWELENLQKGSK